MYLDRVLEKRILKRKEITEMKKMVSIILAATLAFGVTGAAYAEELQETTAAEAEQTGTGQAETESISTSSEAGNEKASAENDDTELITDHIGDEVETLTRIITDHTGVEVEIPTEINRVVIGNTLPLASILTIYLGGAEKIVGMHPASMAAAQSGLLSEIYPEILEAETGFISGSEVNIEELLKLNPDIVIGATAELAQTLRDAGIPAVTFSVSNWGYDVVETYDQWIAFLDEIFGESELSRKVSEYSHEVYEEIQERVSNVTEDEKKRVLFLYNYAEETMTTSGSQFFGQSWCDATGVLNVAQEITDAGAAAINMEQVYAWNPDIIMITNFTEVMPEDLYNNAVGNDDWSNVSAVQNGQVYKMPLGLYRTYTPGADTPVTLQWFAKTMYPELFENVNIEEVTSDYFEEYYGVELTDEQIASIYNPVRESAGGL